MRTHRDSTHANVLAFAGFTFTLEALHSAIRMIECDEAAATADKRKTALIEKKAQGYLEAPSADAAAELTRLICQWGGGDRLLGNLARHHGSDLGNTLNRWMQAAMASRNDEQAVTPHDTSTSPFGVPKGLGISFASKHLRMLDPERWAVLDSVLSLGHGFALNPKGYALFMRTLRTFYQSLPKDWKHQYSLARTESGIFVLVQPHVRGEGLAADE